MNKTSTAIYLLIAILVILVGLVVIAKPATYAKGATTPGGYIDFFNFKKIV